MYNAIRSSVVNIEPGTVIAVQPNGNPDVKSESLAEIKSIDRSKNCLVLSLESGKTHTVTDHALTLDSAEDLLISILGCLCAVGNPIALTLRDAMPLRVEDIPMAYR